MKLLAIDPGDQQSAWLVYDVVAGRPIEWRKEDNALVRKRISTACDAGCQQLAVEMIASYGMPVGREVFETCVWIGQFAERWRIAAAHWGPTPTLEPTLIYRRDVKLHLCGSARAKDANIRQALIDRYGPGKVAAIGRKASPGPLYGLTGDCWSALAVAVTSADTRADGALLTERAA